MFYYFEPEVAGGLGSDTVMSTATHPPVVTILHYEFGGWLGDDILEAFPCFIVTEHLKAALIFHAITGITFDTVIISTSDTFGELYGGRTLPAFFWLKVTGMAGEDDFGIAQDYRLVISQKVLDILQKFNVSGADIEVYMQNS